MNDENAGSPVIMNIVSLIFCLAGAVIVAATCLEAYIAWYSGVEYAGVSPIQFWTRAIMQAMIILAAIATVAYPFLRG